MSGKFDGSILKIGECLMGWKRMTLFSDSGQRAPPPSGIAVFGFFRTIAKSPGVGQWLIQ
jgi:hypothetical protein